MNNKLILALAIAAAPAMAAPAVTLKPADSNQALTIAGEYTMYEAANDTSSYGVAVKLDKVLAPMLNGNYWSWNAAFSYGFGTVDNGKGAKDLDFNTTTIRLGVDANIVTNRNLTVFVGPRIGYHISEADVRNAEKLKYLMFGFSAGLRYKTMGGTGIEIGYTRGYYNRTKDNIGFRGDDNTHTIYGGVSFSF